MAKRGRKKHAKNQKNNLDIVVVGTIIVSILLAVLIYTNSGFLGETLSPILGGEKCIFKSVCGLDRLQKIFKNLANVCLKNTPSVPKNRHLKP